MIKRFTPLSDTADSPCCECDENIKSGYEILDSDGHGSCYICDECLKAARGATKIAGIQIYSHKHTKKEK